MASNVGVFARTSRSPDVCGRLLDTKGTNGSSSSLMASCRKNIIFAPVVPKVALASLLLRYGCSILLHLSESLL